MVYIKFLRWRNPVLDIKIPGLEFDVVNLMSDLLSHWLSVPRFFETVLCEFVFLAGSGFSYYFVLAVC